MSFSLSDPYRALGVEKDADVSAIKSAYRKLVLKCHPDKVQDPTLKAIKQDEFQRVQQAYEILVDETKRKEYDLNVKMRKMRDEVVRNMTRPSAAPRTSPKAYAEYHVRTAEPPPSFKPGPPPSPYSPYKNGGTQHAHPFDREIPVRNRSGYDDGHRARRAASYEKPRETTKEERRRQKEDDVEPSTSAPAREWMREKEHEREKERDKKTRGDREKDEKRERQKRDTEKRERERDRLRRQEQQEKYRSKKAAYVEHYDESEEDVRTSKKKTTNSGSNSKKHADTPRREKSARRDDSPPATETPPPPPPPTDMIQDKMKRAADYMVDTRRRGSKSNTANPHFAEGMSYNSHFPDPDVAWHAKGETPRPRRTSPDEKKFRSRVDADDDVDQFMSKSDRRPPRLSKSYTSPIGGMHVANSSAPRMPSLNRAATMDYPRAPPQAPPAPSPDANRGKTEHRRKGSFDVHDDDLRPRRSSTNPRVVHYPLDESSQAPRTAKPPYYKHSDDYFPSPPRSKTAALYPEQIYETKRYSDEDIVYSTVNHSADHYSSPHPSYVVGAYD